MVSEPIRTAVPDGANDSLYEPDGPIVSHFGYLHDPTVALCGARLIGVPAPETHEQKCPECERLHIEYLRDKFGVSA